MFRHLTFSACIGLVFVAAFLLVALFAPFIAPHGVNDIVGASWDYPSLTAPLGTDMIGRDLLSRFIWGARVTIFTAAAATGIAYAVGTSLGLLAGLRNDWLDTILSRIVDLLMAIPTLIFALVLLTILPRSIVVIVAIMALLESTRFFRLARSVAADIAARDYIETAILRGETRLWIVYREILPNALAPLIAETGLRFIFAVLFLSTLSFLGLGIQPPITDWGSLIKENKDGLLFGVGAALIPGAAIALLAISVNMVVDWILDADARLEQH
ncbi:ABC transporter permease [Agrobacterium larrymoorei]|uniref:ABC transporter permease n=1 Tax=Agrobacterium larrymoorei TaxID=160699 RepID=A0A4D7E0X1_9HYPH|nr:ABC transporter permease [Agrobacterium larrymoorei]QCJ00905.1 ABC transporter permease [Agrobacterium larrymoorei]QYA10240.1 ABC transporter permease [Agrobacterium larrymoorei]